MSMAGVHNITYTQTTFSSIPFFLSYNTIILSSSLFRTALPHFVQNGRRAKNS